VGQAFVFEHELWPGMGQRAPALPAPDPRIEAMRAAVRKGLGVQLVRDEAGEIVVRISKPAEMISFDEVREVDIVAREIADGLEPHTRTLQQHLEAEAA
jgi:hypothetical protein